MTELEREARDFICKKFSVTHEELENKNKDSDFINLIQNYIDLYIAGACIERSVKAGNVKVIHC